LHHTAAEAELIQLHLLFDGTEQMERLAAKALNKSE
jgi:hypothetical protein